MRKLITNINILKLKNWEIFLILFFIPFLVSINLPILSDSFIPAAISVMIWMWVISLWFYTIIDQFKTEYLEKFEIKLIISNLISLNLLFILIVTITFLSFYSDSPFFEQGFNLLSKIDGYIRMYIYAASVSTLIIASRIITAKKIQGKPKIKDYYIGAISFILLPIGIFWIQNEINQLLEVDRPAKRNRAVTIFSFTFFLLIATVANFMNKEITVSLGEDSDESVFDSVWIEKARHQSDSIFNSMDDSSKADYIFRTAIRLYQQGEHRAAVQNMSISIQLDSSNSEYYFNRAVILCNEFNQLDSAVMDLTKAIELAPTDWKAYQNRGYCNYKLENYIMAINDITKVIDLQPDFSNAYLLRGMIKDKLNDKDGACQDLRKAESLGNANAILKIMEVCN